MGVAHDDEELVPFHEMRGMDQHHFEHVVLDECRAVLNGKLWETRNSLAEGNDPPDDICHAA